MATAAKRAYGTLFKQGGTTIAEVRSIGDVGPEAEMIDVTNFDSTAGWKEFIPGLIDGGEVQIEMNFIPGNSSQQGLRTNLTGRSSATYSVVWTDTGETWSFTAYVQSIKPRGGVAEALTATVTFKITGQMTFA